MKSVTTGTYGARYGRKIRHQVAEIDRLKKQNYKCPYCNQLRVKRLSSGIWQCKKCENMFTGRAYTVVKRTVREETKEEE